MSSTNLSPESLSEKTLAELSVEVGERLQNLGKVATTAESCTGGLVATSITDIAGSSSWFGQGWVTYSNRSKFELLDVPNDVLQAMGAVSREVVISMAEGALQKSGADIAVSLSGVAGPGGGSVDKPVGTVWIGWCVRSTEKGTANPFSSDSQRYQFDGDRHSVRVQAACAAILGILDRI